MKKCEIKIEIKTGTYGRNGSDISTIRDNSFSTDRPCSRLWVVDHLPGPAQLALWSCVHVDAVLRAEKGCGSSQMATQAFLHDTECCYVFSENCVHDGEY